MLDVLPDVLYIGQMEFVDRISMASLNSSSQLVKSTANPFELPFPTRNISFFSSFHSRSFPTPASHPDPKGQSSSNKHVCPVCQKSFKLKGGLDVHFRIHTGERPFKCPLCQKGFTTKQNMLTHQSVHMQ